ncbi:MAG: SH3 domain-containing protein [Cytophagales bacterium]
MSNNVLLQKADSLFEKQKYIEALVLYDSLFTKHEIFSPSMLLKMAYISEGKGDIFKTLYFLNVYNLHFPNLKVVRKMESLAKANNLKGFDYSDWEYFVGLYNEYFKFIELSLIACCVLFFVYQAIRFLAQKQINLLRVYLLIFLTTITILVVNIGLPSYKALVIAEQAFGMESASAASKIVTVISQGNQVNVLNKDGVWYEVLFENQTLFLREDHLFMVSNKRVQEQFNFFAKIYDALKSLFGFVWN